MDNTSVMPVEVFKTNVLEDLVANELITILLKHFPGSRINFDLEDCDKILRIEGNNLAVGKVKTLVSARGFDCEVLD